MSYAPTPPGDPAGQFAAPEEVDHGERVEAQLTYLRRAAPPKLVLAGLLAMWSALTALTATVAVVAREGADLTGLAPLLAGAASVATLPPSWGLFVAAMHALRADPSPEHRRVALEAEDRSWRLLAVGVWLVWTLEGAAWLASPGPWP